MQNSFFVSIMLTDKSKLKIKYIDLCEMENSQIRFFLAGGNNLKELKG